MHITIIGKGKEKLNLKSAFFYYTEGDNLSLDEKREFYVKKQHKRN